MIWEAALVPRLVCIKQKALNFTVGDWFQAGCPNRGVNTVLHNESPDESMLGLASDLPPQILLVCKESYGVVSKVYRRAFAMAGSLPGTFFDFHRDTLYLRYDIMTHKSRRSGRPFLDVLRCLRHMKDKSCLGMVENLALLIDSTPEATLVDRTIPGSQFIKWVGNVLQVFGGVKHLTIVHAHYSKASEARLPSYLIEPIDSEAAVAEIRAKGRGSHGGWRTKLSWHWLDFDEITQKDLELHQAAKRQTYHKGRSMPIEGWSIPTIKYKVAVTENIKEYVEAAVRDCEEDLKMWVIRRNE
jgi:hypothetical protein